ncbi:MAG: STAS domain-containing protein [Phycisphaerales bacterium]|jgi:anti-anti-sigma factor|nr:STAS domain-containing protein [Phycisphaerales bacterium]
MTLNQWSEDVLILELQDEPDFSEDTDSLLRKLNSGGVLSPDVIIDLQQVTSLNSSNLGALIECKRVLDTKDRRMIICNINDVIWSTMLATGLDQVFTFIEDTTTALTSLMVGE